ncbi:DUF1761 domain-containing protein [Candidatus Saccharibacteria bacterium]|nr:MAG: DUF1761 domain-containing protein [Candidatus Saccharibacteria bacterium]
MEISVNYLAVLLAALSTMVVGSTWYSPPVFGKLWMKLSGAKPDATMSWGKTALMYGGVLVASLVSAYVLAHVTLLSNQVLGGTYLLSALSTAFWVWLGFTATRMFTHDTFEGRPKKLTLLNAAHELITFLVMGLIIGLMGV